MMSIFTKTSTIRYSFIIFSSLIGLIIFLFILYWFEVIENPKVSAVISGLLTGFIVALFQAGLAWYEIKKIEKLKELKIIEILSTREDPVYYGSLISKSSKEIKLLGVTAQRFLDDFGDSSPNAPAYKKVLIKALDNNSDIKIKFLIANNEVIKDSIENLNKYNLAKPRLDTLTQKYQNKFEYRYYKHEPTHSVLIIDNECIVGPIFPHVESKYTPAIHLRTDSAFAHHYIKYFDEEWNKCQLT